MITDARNSQIWKHKFVERFSECMRKAGYDNPDSLFDVAYQHADASWEAGGGSDLPENAADAEYEALCDSV